MAPFAREIVRFPVGYAAVAVMFCMLLLVVWNSVGMLREGSRFTASFEEVIAGAGDPRPFLSPTDCEGHLSAEACHVDASLDAAWASAPAADRGSCLRSSQQSTQRELLYCLLTRTVRGEASRRAS
jgi:hypothetical protein